MLEKKKLLVISHAPSDNTKRMLEALVKGASNHDIANVEVKCISPLEYTPGRFQVGPGSNYWHHRKPWIHGGADQGRI